MIKKSTWLAYAGIILLTALLVFIGFKQHPVQYEKLVSGSNDRIKRIDQLNQDVFFVHKLSEAAKKQNTVLPSIIVAQGILESDYGQSQLAIQANNLFGIKGNKNNGVRFETKEWVTGENGSQKEVVIEDWFARYDSYEDAVNKHVELMKKGTTDNPKRYEAVINAKNYEEAAHALKEAGYATDPEYPKKLSFLIKKYQLDKLDKEKKKQ